MLGMRLVSMPVIRFVPMPALRLISFVKTEIFLKYTVRLFSCRIMIAHVAEILQSIPSQAAAAEHQQFSNFKDRKASLAVKNSILQSTA